MSEFLRNSGPNGSKLESLGPNGSTFLQTAPANTVPDIRDDESIISIHRKCENCAEIYDATADVRLDGQAICSTCSTPPVAEEHSSFGKTTTKKGIRFKTLPSSGYSSLLPYQIPQVKEILSSIFLGPPNTIVDASAHIGGDTIHFAKTWPLCKIISIDIDDKAVDCLKTNVNAFAPNPENIEIITADSTVWIEEEKRKADLYYFDPPWGGPGYCSADEVSLFLSEKPIVDIVNLVLDQNLSSKVLLKAPRNFAYTEFKKNVHGETRLHYIRKPQKRGSVAYALILIWKKN